MSDTKLLPYHDYTERTAAYATWERAQEVLSALCQGRGRMSIPAHPEDDDLVIASMLARGEQAERERDQLVAIAQAALRCDMDNHDWDSSDLAYLTYAVEALAPDLRARLEATDEPA